MKKKIMLLLALVLTASSVLAQSTIPANYSSYYKSSGRSSGTYYFTIEGGDFGSHSSWGMLEFDDTTSLTAVEGDEILSVELQLAQTDVDKLSWDKAGDVLLLVDPNNSTSMDYALTGRSASDETYTYSDKDSIIGRCNELMTINWEPVSTGFVDSYTLWQKGDAQNDVIEHINNGEKLTFVVAEGTSDVAAPWAGHGSTYYQAPTLIVTYAIGNIDWGDPNDSYGWEDSSTALDVAYHVYVQNVEDESAPEGNNVLEITHEDSGDPSYVYLARINGLADGDVIKASVMAKNMIAEEGISLTGYYIDSEGGSGGSASTSAQSSNIQWDELTWSWVFDEGDTEDFAPRVDFIIEAKFQPGTIGKKAWLDDLKIWVESSNNAEIVFPDGHPTDCFNYYDMDDDCDTDEYELGQFASEWMANGLENIDPNDGTDRFYKVYKYEWNDGGTVISTYPSDDRAPALANVTDPDDSEDGMLEITMGSFYNSSSNMNEVILATIQGMDITENSEYIFEDAPIYVMIEWKGSGIEGTHLQLAGFGARDGGWAGGLFTKPIYTETDKTSESTIMYYKVGNPDDEDGPRDGIAIFVKPEGEEGEVSGYVDSIAVSIPYYEDIYGNLKDINVKFPNNNYGGYKTGTSANVTEVTDLESLLPACTARPEMDFGGTYCIVELNDFAEIATRWLLCDYAAVDLSCE